MPLGAGYKPFVREGVEEGGRDAERKHNYCCPIKVFRRKKSFLFHRIAEFPACQISDDSRESIKCLL